MRILLTIMVWVALVSASFAQKVSISGSVFDENREPLASATVMLLQAQDSVLASFASTDVEGAFSIKRVDPGQYLVKITYVGYATKTESVEVGESDILLDSLVLEPASAVLDEVEVKADFMPLEIKKDTIAYNADAFQTQPNDAVEDLLKKLPGVEVDQSGAIKAQGEDVQNVLVDGKEFFGNDPKMATKNLPADAVDKVQVYDQKSEMAEFSGIDDGERQKTINIQLREDKKKGLFGNAEAGYGYGDQSQYNAKASLNRFTSTQQLSFLGMANNINQQGFSVNEFVNFAGGMQALRGGSFRIGGNESAVPISRGLSDGLARTLAGGVNYNVEIGKKFDLRSSYFYNNINNEVTQEIYRQNYVGEFYETDARALSETRSQGHRVNLIAEYDIDSTQNLEFRSNLSISDGKSSQIDSSLSFVDNGLELRNRSRTDYNAETDRVNFQGDLYYRLRLGNKKGRVLTLNTGVDVSNNKSTGFLNSINEFYQAGNINIIDQDQYQTGEFFQWQGRVSYTEPIGKNKWLEFNYRYRQNTDDSDKDIFDIDPATGLPVLNDTLSIAYTRDLNYHRPGLTFRLNSRKSSLSVGLQYQDTDLDGTINGNENRIQKDFMNVLPSVRFRHEFATARSLRFDYDTDVNVPDIEELSPVIDNSNPLRIYLGNPDLKAEYEHEARLSFHSFSQFSNTSIFAMIRGDYTVNRIITSKSVDSNLVELSIPVNIDGDYRLTGYGSYSTHLNFIRTRIRVNGRLTYQNSKLFLNIRDGGMTAFEESGVERWNRSMGLSFSSLNSEVYEFDLGGNWSFNSTYYEQDRETDQNFFNHSYYFDFTLNFLKNWQFESDFNLGFFSGEQFGENEVIPLWTASISRFLFKDKRAELKLTVFDILNENRGVAQTANSNYLQEIRSNSLSRYAMLSFIYSLKGFGGEENRFEMSRRWR